MASNISATFLYIQDKNKFNNIQKLYRNEGRDGSTNVNCHWKSIECWVGTKNLDVCCGYNTPTLFRNLQKKSLVCTLQTCYPLWSMIRLFILQPPPILHLWMHWTALWVWFSRIMRILFFFHCSLCKIETPYTMGSSFVLA